MEELNYEIQDALVEQEYQAFIQKLVDERRFTKSELQEIKRAYEFAKEAHKSQRRKSGEPYISHPLRVAKIVYEEMGLFAVSIIAAFLHDVVEDTTIEHSDIQQQFGVKVSKIVEGLTKISKAEALDDSKKSMQAENFRRILLTISDDIRVILVKIADRLHNMRTLNAMKPQGQLKIASETVYLYAPVAHRLGLYSIKSELEDLALMYLAPVQYAEINQKLNTTKEEAETYIQHFIGEVKRILAPTKLNFQVKSRFKSVYSIYNKIQTKHVSFEEIMDLYAIRIILEDREGAETEDCWRVYTFITEKYTHNPARTRDWLRFPKANGYQSLHITVKGPESRAIEIQIRTKKMDEIAEKGNGAHWMYKAEDESIQKMDATIVKFIEEVRKVLENPNLNDLEAVQEVQAGLKPESLSVFSPKGDLKTLPADACVLDFAYDIHTKIGDYAIGAKINGKLFPLNTTLHAGDVVEVIISQKKTVSEEWLSWVKSLKARNIIKESLKVQRKELIPKGREIFNMGNKWLKITEDHPEMEDFLKFAGLKSKDDLFFEIAKNKEYGKSTINVAEKLRDFLHFREENKQKLLKVSPPKEENTLIDTDVLVLGKDLMIDKTIIASCCNPVPGDDIVGIQRKKHVTIHRSDCETAIYFMANYGNTIVKASFANDTDIAFLTALKVEGLDSQGILIDILKVISYKMQLGLRKVTIDSKDGRFEGAFLVYIRNVAQLNELTKRLKDDVPYVQSVSRTDSNFEPFEKLV